MSMIHLVRTRYCVGTCEVSTFWGFGCVTCSCSTSGRRMRRRGPPVWWMPPHHWAFEVHVSYYSPSLTPFHTINILPIYVIAATINRWIPCEKFHCMIQYLSIVTNPLPLLGGGMVVTCWQTYKEIHFLLCVKNSLPCLMPAHVN
jgi:hypothetical protein